MLAEEKMFKYEMVNLPKIAIIGKEGLCTKEKIWICLLTLLYGEALW